MNRRSFIKILLTGSGASFSIPFVQLPDVPGPTARFDGAANGFSELTKCAIFQRALKDLEAESCLELARTLGVLE